MRRPYGWLVFGSFMAGSNTSNLVLGCPPIPGVIGLLCGVVIVVGQLMSEGKPS